MSEEHYSEDPPARSHGRRSIRPSARPRELIEEQPPVPGAWLAQVITLLPEAFPGVLGLSLTGRALERGLWALNTVDLRRFGIGRHRNVDDTPAGGGPGMVLRPDVLGAAIDVALAGAPAEMPLIAMSPRGRRFDQSLARRLATGPGVTILCGRFEGFDERIFEEYPIEEISLGDFVLTGGEIAAQAVIDASVRLLPGVLGNEASAAEESFSAGLLEHPQYTRPAEWRGRRIPEVLLSGNHAEIARWRRQMAEELTRRRRPDLIGEDAPRGNEDRKPRANET